MKTIQLLMLIILATCQDGFSAPTPEELARNTYLTVRLIEAPPAEALGIVGRMSKLMIHLMTTPDEHQRITVIIYDAPASEVLEYVANQANLKLSYESDGVYLASK